MLLPKNLFLKFLCTPIEPKQKTAAEDLIRSYPLLQLITDMMRVTNRIDMHSLLNRFEDLKKKSEIRFDMNIVRKLNEFSSRKFEDTTNYLMQIDHIS